MAENDAALRDILRRMVEAQDEDQETAHIQADRLLQEVIPLLAPENATVSEILIAYDEIGKWYA